MNDDKKTDQWFYSTNGDDRNGPVTLEKLITLLAQGSITFDSLVWHPSLKDWKPARATPEIITYYPVPQPPPLPEHSKEEASADSTSSPLHDSFAASEEVLFGDNKQKREPVTEMGMNVGWLNFYTYIRIPLSILLSVAYVIHVLLLGNIPYFLLILFITAIEICFSIFLLIGLHKRRRWGWWLNWFSLVGEVLLGPLARANDPMEYYTFVIALALFWLIPNAIYFMKRYKLFTQQNLPNQKLQPTPLNAGDEVNAQGGAAEL